MDGLPFGTELRTLSQDVGPVENKQNAELEKLLDKMIAEADFSSRT